MGAAGPGRCWQRRGARLMASAEMAAWERLSLLGAIPPEERFSPLKARDGFYTARLKEVLPKDLPAEAGDVTASPKPTTPEAKLEALATTAGELLAGRVAYAARLPLLRAAAEKLDFTIPDQELLALLTAARRRRANNGDDDMVQPGKRLDLTPEPWAWDGIALRGAMNLWVALPKIGKTALALAWLNACHRREPAFLDRALIGPCPPVLIVGTDQGQADWGRIFQAVGWVDPAGTSAARWWVCFMPAQHFSLDPMASAFT